MPVWEMVSVYVTLVVEDVLVETFGLSGTGLAVVIVTILVGVSFVLRKLGGVGRKHVCCHCEADSSIDDLFGFKFLDCLLELRVLYS